MTTQIEKYNFQELTTSEQQLISGGYRHCSPCCQPPRCCNSNSYDESMPYMNFRYAYGY